MLGALSPLRQDTRSRDWCPVVLMVLEPDSDGASPGAVTWGARSGREPQGAQQTGQSTAHTRFRWWC